MLYPVELRAVSITSGARRWRNVDGLKKAAPRAGFELGTPGPGTRRTEWHCSEPIGSSYATTGGLRRAPCAVRPCGMNAGRCKALAVCNSAAGSPGLFVPVRHCGVARDRLAVQQHGQECVCGGSVSRHAEPDLATGQDVTRLKAQSWVTRHLSPATHEGKCVDLGQGNLAKPEDDGASFWRKP